MRSLVRRSLGLLALAVLLTAFAVCGAQAGSAPGKTGILLVAFGTTVPEARASYDAFERSVREAFPGVPVRWAYTSHIVRKRIAARGLAVPSVPQALETMRADGVRRVAVQSLHVIPGEEYHDKLLRTVLEHRRRANGFEAVALGDPLLSTHEDMKAAAAALLASVPAERGADDAMVFMGHGTHHPANIYYPGLQWYLSERDPLAFTGTVEGAPGLDWVLDRLKAEGVKRVWLQPLMTVAGDHARNDMAGDEPGSWKSVLDDAGFEVHPVLRGMGEYAAFRAIWLDHLRSALQRLE